MDSSNSELEPVELLADEFVERQRRGERPTIDEYVRRHPDMASEIREVFPALLMMERIAPATGDLEQSQGTVQSPDHIPLKQIGDYRVLREIGRGGMGVVYEAEQQSLRRRVALKVLPRQIAANTKLVERFQREARAAARMHHTNIVPVFEVGKDDETIFYAMQLIQGQGLDLVIEDLKRLRSEHSAIKSGTDHKLNEQADYEPQPSIAASLISGRFRNENLSTGEVREPALSPRRTTQAGTDKTAFAETIDMESGSTVSAALPGQSDISTAETNRVSYFRSVAQIGLQTAQALSYANARGIIHRDIKPSNLLLDSAGTVWVTDFGLAKTGDESMTHTGDILGTIRYMSPERFRGQCDVRADVYALGLTLYEMLLLKPAFESPDRLKLIDMVSRTEPIAPRSIDPRIPRDLETIVLKSIDKEPKHRYQSADELAADLQLFINDDPIKARRVSLVERFGRWSRRNKPLAASLSVVALLVVVVAIGATGTATYYQRQESIQRGLVVERTTLANNNAKLAEEKELLAEAKVAEADNAIAARTEAERLVDLSRRALYGANMQLAGHHWESESSTASTVDKLLAAHIPLDDQDDLRDFAWRFHWGRLHQGSVLTEILEGSPSVSFLPNGGLMAVDLRLQLRSWNPDHSVEPQTKALDLPERATQVQLAPDGMTLVVVTPTGKLHLIDAQTGNQVRAIDPPHPVTRVNFAPDGRRLVTMSNREEVARVWDVVSGDEQQYIRLSTSGHFPLVQSISPDGRSVLLGNYPANSRIFVQNEQGTPTISQGHISTIHSTAFSPDGKSAASGDANGRVILWDTATWDKRDTLTVLHHQVSQILFSPDSLLLAIGGYDGTVAVWSIADIKQQILLKGHTAQIVSLAFSRDANSLASASDDGIVKLWSFTNTKDHEILNASYVGIGVRLAEEAGETRITELVPNSPAQNNGELHVGDRILGVAEDDAGEMVDVQDSKTAEVINLIRGRNGTSVRMKVLSSGGESPTGVREVVLTRAQLADENTDGRICRTAISSNGRWLAVIGWVGTTLWSQPDNELTPVASAAGYSLAFSPDSSVLAMDDLGSQSVKFWSLAENRVIDTWNNVSPVGALAYSPDGRFLAAGMGNPFNVSNNSSMVVRIWDAIAGKEVQTLSGHQGFVNGVAFSPQGTLLATASQDGSVKLWNVPDWSESRTLKVRHRRLLSLAISPDGGTVAAGDESGAITLWDVSTGEVIDTLEGHGFWVVGLSFSPEGRTLASASWDHTIKLWNMASLMQSATLRGHSGWVNGINFSPNGSTLVTAGFDGTVRLWRAPNFAEIDEHPLTLRSMQNLAVSWHQRDRPSDSRALLRRTLELQRRVLGEGHRDTIESMRQLAGSYFNQREWNEAARQFAATLAVSVSARGLDDPLTQLTLSNVNATNHNHVNELRGRNDLAGAKAVYLEALAQKIAILGQEHSSVANTSIELAQVCQELGEPDAAIEHYQRCLAIRRNILAADDILLSDSEHRLGVVLAERGDAERAASLLADALRIRRLSKYQPKYQQGLADTIDALANLLSKQDNAEDWQRAETLWLESLSRKPSADILAKVTHSLAGLYQTWDKPGDAAMWEAKLAQMKGETAMALKFLKRAVELKPDDPVIRFDYAELLLDLARKEEAVEEWNRARPLLEQSLAQGTDNAAHARLLATGLLRFNGVQWTVLSPIETKSLGGATLTLLADGSVLASGVNPNSETYVITAPTNLPRITALRLEIIPDPSLPHFGGGRYPGNGNFHLSEFSLKLRSAESATLGDAFAVTQAFSDYAHPGNEIETSFDEKLETWWETFPQQRRPRFAIFEFDEIVCGPDATLVIQLDSANAVWSQHALGRFRISVTNDVRAIPHAAMHIELLEDKRDAWIALAEAYLATELPAPDELVTKNWRVRVGRANLHSQLENWSEAIEDYSRVITPETKDAHLLAKRAEAYDRLEQWEQAAADWGRADELALDKNERYGNPGLPCLEHRARDFERLGQFDKQLADYDTLLEPGRFPNHPWFLSYRATTYRKLRQWDKALGDHSKALDVCPETERHHFYHWRGATLASQAQWDTAADDLELAMAKHDWWVARDHALLRCFIGDREGLLLAAALTEERLNQELGEEAANGDQARWLALVHLAAPGAVTDANVEWLRKVVEVTGEWHEPRLKAFIAFRAGQLDEARRLFELSPGGTEYDFVSAMTHHALGDRQRARELVEQGSDWIELQRQKTPDDGVPQDQSWQDWLVFIILQREAESLINGNDPPTNSSTTHNAEMAVPDAEK